jgi:ribonuclease-3
MTTEDSTLPHEMLERLRECESRLNYKFVDKNFLVSALTHASGASHRLNSNERLEFLGDSILGTVICEQLFRCLPSALEGELTRIKSVVVSRQTCAKVSAQLDLAPLLLLGKGMATGPAIPPSVLSDVFEALVAAIYLDGGFEPAKRFVLDHMQPEIDATTSAGHGDNYKSQLQQVAQRRFGNTPVYKVLDEKGPDHNKTFNVAARIGDRVFEAAWGRNKKEAEQRAASHALTKIDEDTAAETARRGSARPIGSDSDVDGTVEDADSDDADSDDADSDDADSDDADSDDANADDANADDANADDANADDANADDANSDDANADDAVLDSGAEPPALPDDGSEPTIGDADSEEEFNEDDSELKL